MKEEGTRNRVISLLGGQMTARLLATALRFGLAVVIIQSCGVGTFGGYALILSLLLLSESLLDFGLADWVARSISASPDRTRSLLASMMRARLVLFPLAAVLLIGAAIAVSGESDLLGPALLGVVELIVYGGILYYRSLLKAAMRMDREAIAELCGLILSLPAYGWVVSNGGGVTELVACYLASRVGFLGFVAWLGKRDFVRPEVVESRPAAMLLREVGPLGVSMMLVAIHTTLDPVMVAAFLDPYSVGILAGCQRLLLLMLLLTVPISDLLLPILARFHGQGGASFAKGVALGASVFAFLSGGLFAGFHGGSEFLLGLLGSEMLEGNPLFRLLCAACLLRGLALISGPTLVAAGRLDLALKITALLVAVKVVLLVIALRMFGLIGAGYAMVAGEILNLLISMAVVRHVVERSVGLGRSLGLGLAAGLAAGLACLLPFDGSFAAGMLAGISYLVLCIMIGLLNRGFVEEFLAMVKTHGSEEAP